MARAPTPFDAALAKRTGENKGADGAVALLWTLMAALLPLFFGGVTGAGRLWKETLCFACIVLWAVSLIWRRKVPRASMNLVIPCCSIAVVGWLSSLNASFQFQGYSSGFVALSDVPRWLPSAIDASVAASKMQQWTSLFILAFMLKDLCSESNRRAKIRTGIQAGGLLVLCIGLGQKLADAQTVLGSGKGANQPFFSTFIYPGTAGAYLNLLFPAFCISASKRGRDRVLGLAGIAGIAVSWLWNTSRISTFIGFGALLAVGWLWLTNVLRGMPLSSLKKCPASLRRHRVGIFASILLITLVFSVFPVPPQVAKWMAHSDQVFGSNPRFEAMKVCGQIAKDSGLWGMGPGSFALVFPFYASQSTSIEVLQGFWRHAHCEYIELFIEWGWIGILPWVWIAAFVAYRAARKAFSHSPTQSWESICTASAIGIISLHSVMDSPLQNPSVLMITAFWAACATCDPTKHNETQSIPFHKERPSNRLRDAGKNDLSTGPRKRL